MTKIYLKKDCEFKDSRIIHGDEIVAIDNTVIRMLDLLEESLQKACFLLDQPAPQEAPSLDKFEKISNVKKVRIAKPKTPEMDKKIENAMKLMEEADMVGNVDSLNDMINEFEPLFDFVESCYVIDSPDGSIEPIDLHALGNPLALDSEDIVAAIATIKQADLHCQGSDIQFKKLFKKTEDGGSEEVASFAEDDGE